MNHRLISCAIILLVLFSISSFFASTKVLATTTYFSDDFENFPTGWTVTQLLGTTTKSSTQKYGGTYSMCVSSIVSASYTYSLPTPFTAITSDFHTVVWIYVDSSAHDNYTIIVAPVNTGGNAAYVARLKYHDSAWYIIEGDDGSNNEDVGTLTADTWHKIDIYYFRSGGYVHYWVDGSQVGANFTKGATANINVVKMYVGDTTSTAFLDNGVMYLDDLVLDSATETNTYTFTFSETPKALNTTEFLKAKTLTVSETGYMLESHRVYYALSFEFNDKLTGSAVNAILYALVFRFNENSIGSAVNMPSYALSFVFPEGLSGSGSGSGNKLVNYSLVGFSELLKLRGVVTFYIPEMSLFDPVTFLYGDGALFGFLIIIAILLLIQAVSPYSCVVTTPLSVLIALMYFKRFVDYPPLASNEYLIWYGVFMSILAFVLVIFRRHK